MKNFPSAKYFTLACTRLVMLFLLVTGPVSSAYSQRGIDLTRIKEQTTDSASIFYYAALVDQFKTDAASMTLPQAQFLYYGKLYTKGYATYGPSSDDAKAFTQALRAGKFARAILLGEKVLKTEPVNFEVIAGLHVCHLQEGQTEKAALRQAQIGVLIGAITSSGTGRSLEEGFLVTSIADEYVLMPVMGMESIRRKGSHNATAGITDIWLVKDPDTKEPVELFLTVVKNPDAKF